MVRRAERPRPADPPAGEIAGEAADHADFQHLRRLERRQNRWQPPRQHRLAGAGRPDHQQIVPARGGDFERALGGLLAFDVLEVRHLCIPRIRGGLRPPETLQSLEVVDELEQVLRGEDAHVGGGPRGFGAAARRADQPFAERVGADRGGQRARDGGDRAVERQFAQHAETLDGVAGDGARRRHQPERDRKIVMAAFLGEVGGSEIDGDALRRQRQADGVQRAAHPLAAFRHGLVGEADNGEVRQPWADLHLHVDGARFDALESDRRDPREHR